MEELEVPQVPIEQPSQKKKWNIIVPIFLLLALFIFFFSRNNINEKIIIHISANEPLSSVALELQKNEIVENSAVLIKFVKIFKFGHPTEKGDYLFRKNSSVLSVAWMLARGHHGIDPLRITLKEGATNQDIANILSVKMPDFNKEDFLSDPKSKQGYLFPDTYFFFPLTTPSEILEELSDNFTNRIKPFNNEIEKSNHKLDELITMASIIQKEALGKSDAPIISGILWKRISMGMPLQVDADMSTYKRKGLPDRPISNPGLTAIEASLNPIETTHLYYLHEKNGMVHYADTFAEHKANIIRYLK